MSYNHQKAFVDDLDKVEEYRENKYEITYRKRMRKTKHTVEELSQYPIKTCYTYARNMKEAAEKAKLLLHAESSAKVEPGQHTILSIKLVDRVRSNNESMKRNRDNSMLENEKAVEQGEHNNETKG